MAETMETGGAPVDVGATPTAPSGAPADVAPSQQRVNPTVPPPRVNPAVSLAQQSAAPAVQSTPPPLTGDDALLFGPQPGSAGPGIAQTGPKIPPPPDAQAWYPLLAQLASSPDASPGLKNLLQLLAYHLAS